MGLDMPFGYLLASLSSKEDGLEAAKPDASRKLPELVYTMFVQLDRPVPRVNEARFLNDYHGVPGDPPPNSQFWPYFDPVTGEKRMAIKTIANVVAGQELLVDYGGRYFAKDSSDDSDMHDSDDEFNAQPKKRRKTAKGSKRK